MHTPSRISAKQARIRFGQLLDKAFYQGEEFVIVKKKTPMAVIVGIPQWQKIKKTRLRKAAMPKFGAHDMGEIKIPLTRKYMYD